MGTLFLEFKKASSLLLSQKFSSFFDYTTGAEKNNILVCTNYTVP